MSVRAKAPSCGSSSVWAWRTSDCRKSLSIAVSGACSNPFLTGMRHARQMPVEQQHMAKPPAGEAGLERPVQPLDIGAVRIKLAIVRRAKVLIHALAGKTDRFLQPLRPVLGPSVLGVE